jgi:hypothetical protein
MKTKLMTVFCSAALLVSGYAQSQTGVVACWSGGGGGKDSVGTNSGTLANVTFTDGPTGKAFHFNGLNTEVEIPDAPDLKPANITAETWVRFAAQETPDANSPGLQVVVFKLNTRDPHLGNFTGYSLCKDGDHFTFCVGSPGGQQVMAVSRTVPQIGVWYHIAGTYDGNDLKLYVNGAKEGGARAGFPLDIGSRPLFIGTSGEWYDGKLEGDVSDVTLYRRTLPAEEIRSDASSHDVL